MFGKKYKEIIAKQQEQIRILSSNYTTWESDLGFLVLIISRATSAHKVFFLETYSSQLEGNMMIKDEDLTESYNELVEEIVSTLSDEYVNYLVTRYFKSKEKLIQFVSDSVYMEVIKNASMTNKAKLQRSKFTKTSTEILSLNTEKGQ
jgi:hypothetical protein